MLFVAGEEQGLLGSKYYSLHPTFAPGKIAANINYDGGNYRGRTRDLTQHRRTASRRWTRIVEGAGREAGPRRWCPTSSRTGAISTAPTSSIFAKIGVPALYFDNGTDYIGKPAGWGKQEHEEWDRARLPPAERRDRPTTWVFDGMIEDATIGF